MDLSNPTTEAQRLLNEDLSVAPKPNRQLFENSRLYASTIEADYKDSPCQLYSDKDPNLAVLHEKPWHRAVVYLVIKGLTNREIAERFGKTEPWISQLTRQPWFKNRVVQELKEAGGDLVETILQSQVIPSIEKVIELRDGANSEAIQMRAASEILDRFMGKPTQKIEQRVSGTYKHATVSVEEVDRELEMVNSQLKAIQPTLGNVNASTTN